jgi:hypothetical protein
MSPVRGVPPEVHQRIASADGWNDLVVKNGDCGSGGVRRTSSELSMEVLETNRNGGEQSGACPAH